MNAYAEPSEWLANGRSHGLFSLLLVKVYDFKLQTTSLSFDKVPTCVKNKWHAVIWGCRESKQVRQLVNLGIW